MPFVLLIFSGLFFFLTSCGAGESDSKMYDGVNTGSSGTTENQSLKDVTLSDQTGQTIVTPPNIPPQDAKLRTIKFRANLTFKPTVGKSFAYSNSNWGLRFSRAETPETLQTPQLLFRTRDTDKKLKITGDGFVPGGTSKVISFSETAVVEFQLDLEETDWEKIHKLMGPNSDDQRQKIAVRLFYALNDTASFSQPESYAEIAAVYMQNDIGTIEGATKVTVVGSSSGEITLEFAGPADLSALLPAKNYKRLEGSSILSGYRIMYWKEGDCTDANWVFESNPIFRTLPTMPDPSFSCNYPDPSQFAQEGNSCPLGCSEAGSDLYHAKENEQLSDEDAAIPLNSGTCYQVASVPPGRATFSITGLENNARYFVIAWPLDSAGTLGLSRSSCVQAVPLEIPLAASQDGNESASDCFVATAASGSSSSLTVHYWRIIRDRWLDRLGFSELYYKYAPRLAAKLEKHPTFKPFVNAVLLHSGRFLVAADRQYIKLSRFFSSAFAQLKTWQKKLFGAQWNSSAHGAEPETDLPRSKLLRPYTEIEAEAEAEKPTKAIIPSGADPAQAGSADSPEELPSKALKREAESGKEQGEHSSHGAKENADTASEQPTKALPPPSAQPLDADKQESSRFPNGSAFSAIRFSGGIFAPQETALWKIYYPQGSPFFLSLGQTFRIIDLFGEFGLGFQAIMQNHSGRVPATLSGGTVANEAVVGKRISYYQAGLYLAGDYRLRYMPLPPLAPRFLVNVGMERLRETAQANRVKEDVDTGKGKVGITLWKPMVQAGLSLELSFGALFGKGFLGKVLGYGARDLLLGATGLYAFDLSDHKFSQTGLLAGGSLVLLVE